MSFNEVSVKESPGLCRCCLSEGCYKDLGTEYTWMNENEVYADMLLDCFDIGITQHSDGPNGAKRLICEVCITRLRDACNFKKQVLDSEKKFVDMLGRGEFAPKVVLFPHPMKAETVEEMTIEDVDSTEVEYLDDIDYVPDEEVKEEEEVPAPSSSKKRGRPKKEITDQSPKKQKVKEKTVKVNKGVAKVHRTAVLSPEASVPTTSVIKMPKQPSAKEKRNFMIHNVLQVLTKTNAMPFRWLRSSYRCFYCYEIFQDASDLKAHQKDHIGDEIKEKMMRNYWEQVVYLDVTNLHCSICKEKVPDLYDMIDHLINNHSVIYNKDIGVCMVAFVLDNFNVTCLACGANFYTFGPLLHHTNTKHKGVSAHLCDVCGQHFKDFNLLRNHVKLVHENSGSLCSECGEKFETRSKLIAHQKNQHLKKYKCLVCTETFMSNYLRSRHMVSEHKNRPEIKCAHCPKTFVFRSMMLTHLRDTHLKVRDHVCGVCGWKAFNSNRLKNHMYKHSGEKNFKCDACDKAFTTKKIMKAHYARMHKQPQIIPYM